MFKKVNIQMFKGVSKALIFYLVLGPSEPKPDLDLEEKQSQRDSVEKMKM